MLLVLVSANYACISNIYQVPSYGDKVIHPHPVSQWCLITHIYAHKKEFNPCLLHVKVGQVNSAK